MYVEYVKNGKTVKVELKQSDVQHLWNAVINHRNGYKARFWEYNLMDVYDWVMQRQKRSEIDTKEYSQHGQGD